jgi:tetratricopeptide (TPR) repeat protein/DNA-binding CsgD family transcriptional regulator
MLTKIQFNDVLNSKNHTSLYVFFFLFILTAPFCSCTKPEKTDNSQSGDWKMAFAKRLPHDKPEVCLQLINDSIRLIKDRAWACENVMYNAVDEQNQKIYNQHLDNFEALARGVFTELGQKESERFYAEIQMFRGFKHAEVGEYDRALPLFAKSLTVFEAVKDTELIYKTRIKTANIHAQKGNYIEATDVMLNSLSYVKADDFSGRADYLNELAYCYGKSKNTEKAKMIEYEAIHFSEKARDTPQTAQIYSNMATYFVNLKQGDSALWATQKSSELFAAQKRTDGLPYTYSSFGGAYRLLGNHEKALEYSNAALRIFDSLQQHVYVALSTAQIGNCFQTHGDWQLARNNYEKAIQILDSFPNPSIKSRVYDSLTVLAFQERGDWTGLQILRDNKHYQQNQFTTERQQIVENMNVRYETAQRNEQIKTLDFDNKALKLQLLLGALSLLAILGIVGFIIFRNRQQKAILEKENELLAAKEKATKVELTANQQQLATFTGNILSKNQLISDLEVQISQLTLQEAPLPSDDDEFNRERLANMKILTDDDWRAYQKHFSAVHKDFMRRAEQDLSDLTAGELRLFMLLRQGFDSKDMADVLGISLSGIKKSRHRLRKKLNLSEEENLEAFVQAF